MQGLDSATGNNDSVFRISNQTDAVGIAKV
jgi:hypothetical protein